MLEEKDLALLKSIFMPRLPELAVGILQKNREEIVWFIEQKINVPFP